MCIRSDGLTITLGPFFTPSFDAPLAGSLQLETDVPSRVSVAVTDGTNAWTNAFFEYTTNHSITLLGFKPGTSNQINVTVYDALRHSFTAGDTLTFVTAPLASYFPHSTVIKSQPSKMEPGYTLLVVVSETTYQAYIVVLDKSGTVVWYVKSPPSDHDIRQLPNGDLFMPSENGSIFVEMNMLGLTVNTWTTPTNYPINFHDGVPTDHGTILYLTDAGRREANFPTSDTNPNAPLKATNVDYNLVVEISATNSALLNTWSLIDMLDPYRLTYLTFEFTTQFGIDIQHANAVLEAPSDNSLIVSLREQNAVVKFTRDGQLKWILGPPARWPAAFQKYLLTPVGQPFEWNYGQHGPQLTPQGTLLLYDDGNYRGSPFVAVVPDHNNYSRAVEYSINETNMTVSQVWDSGRTNDDCLFTPVVGNTDWLPKTGNVLATFGYVTYVNGVPPYKYQTNATMVRIKEFTHDSVPQVVFDLSFWLSGYQGTTYKGYFAYRSHRIADLYPHPLAAVADLTVQYENGIPHLEFSGDPTLTYAIQASTDLVDWTVIGTPVAGNVAGEFDFFDLAANPLNATYYRVVTQQPIQPAQTIALPGSAGIHYRIRDPLPITDGRVRPDSAAWLAGASSSGRKVSRRSKAAKYWPLPRR